MIELCFGESVRGSIRMSKSRNDSWIQMGEGVHVFGDLPEGERCRKEEQELLRRDAQPLEGEPEDVLSLPPTLDVGDIQDPLGEERRALLRRWYLCDDVDQDWHRSRETAARLAACGPEDRVRVWVDQTPGSACGLLYAASLLEKTGASVSMMPLPPWRVQSDSSVVIYQGWGEVSPEEFGHFLNLEQPLTPIVLRVMADRWRLLQAENAPLRAVVNGRVRSVGADFYDDCIRRALPAGQKRIAQVIGEVLGRERPGIGDALLADRILVLLDRGEYRMVQENRERFYGSIIEKT